MEDIVIYSAVCLASFTLWRLVRSFFVPSPLSKVPGPPGASPVTGHLQHIFGDDAWNFHEHLLDYGGVAKVNGLMNEEQLYISDPVALNHIILKGHESFEQDTMILSMAPVIWGPAFAGLPGDHHKKQRKMLNPVFSVQHMRGLVPVLYPIAYELRDVFVKKIKSGQNVIDVFHWTSLAALEFIGRGGLGHAFDALNLYKKNEYNEYIKAAISTMTSMAPVMALLPYIGNIGPAWFRRKIVDWTPSKTIHKLRDIVDVMHSTSVGIYRRKKAALEMGEDALMSEVANGKDIMTILYAQAKLRKEVNDAREKYGGQDLDYDELMSLPYLDAICRETLRLHPPTGVVWREAVQDTVLPMRHPMKLVGSKEEVTSLPLKKGTKVIISILNANRSKEIWGEDAAEWKPERWLNPLPDSVAKAKLPGVFSNMMTFVGGGRACIGFKFAELEMKMLLFVLLESFSFSIEDGMDITWSFKVIKQPSVVGADGKPGQKSELPLRISLLPGTNF
ncbi:cytochrome P450 [Schizopora paradoxa]|uniref:Cytochrome P450 n=1 Tax=Schizopora paradoxa TaxID=27342 RepID=A0A0H2RP78_9AGAM|nr:cytochrome P450 [Schizopora paradoxa]